MRDAGIDLYYIEIIVYYRNKDGDSYEGIIVTGVYSNSQVECPYATSDRYPAVYQFSTVMMSL